MSNQEEIQESWYEKNGRKYHKDSFGDWYINDKGYENIFMNQITDQEFKDQVETIIENTEEDRYQFDYGGVQHTVWIKHDDPQKSSVSRREKANSSQAERVYDNIQTGKPQTQTTQQKTGGYQPQKRDRPITDKNKVLTLSDDAFHNDLKLEPFWSLDDKANPNVFMIKEQNGTISWRLILKHITFTY